MIETIIGSKVSRLHKSSQNVLDVFTKTVTDLQGLNAEIDTHATKKEAEKKKLEEDLAKLISLKENHDKVITKINKIFE